MALAKDSPFLSPGEESPGSASGARPAFELAGGSVTSSGSEVCIYDVNAKRSHWIGVGDADGAIQVVSYDAAGDQAVVRIDGVQQTLDLRKEAASPNPSSITPFVAAGATVTGAREPVISVEEARARRESRMLVTDLMDIGMRQRQAHEAALRQAVQNGQ
jgi:hypothetical protein